MTDIDRIASQLAPDGHASGDRSMRVLLGEPTPLLRMAISSIIEQHADIELVASAPTGSDAVELFKSYAPDVALLDCRPPRWDGLEATRRIRQSWPRARIVLLTGSVGAVEVRRALQAGAAGCIPMDVEPEALIEALRGAHAAQQVVPPEIALQLAAGMAQRDPSPRELEVLQLAALGNPNKKIATLLDVTVDTIKAHMKSVLIKLRAKDRTHAVALALRRGLIASAD